MMNGMMPGGGGPNFSGGNDPVRSAALNMLQRGGTTAPQGAPAPGAAPGGMGAGANPMAPGSIGAILGRLTEQIAVYVAQAGWTPQDSEAVNQFIQTLASMAAPFVNGGGAGMAMPPQPQPPAGTGMLPQGNMMAQGAPGFRNLR